MAVRLKALYYGENNIPYGLEIHDTELVSDSNIDFDMPMAGAPTIVYENSEDDIFTEVVPAKCTFTIELNTVDHASFYNDYVLSAEGRFLIRLYYIDVGGNVVPLFIGKLLHDVSSLDDNPWQELTLSAADPLLELSEIDFLFQGIDDANYNWGYASYITILTKYILNKSTTLQYFFPNGTDKLLHVFNEYRSIEHEDATDILSKTYIKDYFRNAESGQVEIRSCLYGIGEILRSLGSRIYYDSGVYVIEQLNSRNNNSFTYSMYQVDGSFVGTETRSYILNHDNKPYFIYAYPQYTFLAPIKSVVLEQNGYFKENLIYELALDQLTLVTFDPEQISTVTDLSGELRVYLRINIRNWMEKYTNFDIGSTTTGPLAPYQEPWAKYGYYRYSIYVKVGNKYLNGNGTIVYNPSSQQYYLSVPYMSWSSNSNSRVRVFIPFSVMFSDFQQNANAALYTVDIVSPIIEEEGDVFFDMTYGGVFNSPSTTDIFNNTDLPDPSERKQVITGSTLAIVSDVEDASDEKGSTITTLVNDESNTVVHDIRYDMGSFTVGANHGVKVHNGTELVNSEEWVHPDHGQLDYQLLAIHDILSFKRIAREKLYMTMEPNAKSPLRFIHGFKYKSKLYIPLTLSYNTGIDVAEYSWIEIDKQISNVLDPVVELPVLDFVENPFVSLPPVVSSLQGTETSTAGYYKLVESGVGDNVDVSDYAGLPNPSEFTHDSIRKSVKVHLGGSKQRFRDVPKLQLKQGEFRINFEDKTIEWKKSIAGKVIEIDADDHYVVQEEIAVS